MPDGFPENAPAGRKQKKPAWALPVFFVQRAARAPALGGEPKARRQGLSKKGAVFLDDLANIAERVSVTAEKVLGGMVQIFTCSSVCAPLPRGVAGN